MKKFFAIILVLLVYMSAHGAKCARHSGQPVHFMTVDDSGHPIPGVKVRLFWSDIDRNGVRREAHKKLLVSDKDGRFCSEGSFPGEAAYLALGWGGVPQRVVHWKNDEYVLEGYLNSGGGWTSWAFGSYPKDHPYKLVLRKKLPGQGLVFIGGKWDDVKLFRRGEKREPFPLAAVYKPGCKEMQPADCFAMPEFDEVKNAWKCSFWTTNVNGGVFATTNRVFIAPTTGYQKRIEVPIDMCCSPTFTLYVKTYDPLLYAMFWIHCFGRDHEEAIGTGRIGWRRLLDDPQMYYPDSGKSYAGIVVDSCRFNVFGGRCLETDLYADEAVGFQFFIEEVLPALAQHQYPPRPDISARAKNMQLRKALREEIFKNSEMLSQILTKANGDRK